MYKAIIFDLDNTLINYSTCEIEAMKRTCSDHNLFVEDTDAWSLFYGEFSGHNFRHWMNFVGGGEVKTIGEVLRYSFRDTLKQEELLHCKLSDTYWDYFCNSCYFEEGAEQILTSFKDKYALGIITNGISDAQRKRLQAGKIYEIFKSIMISDEVGIRKPDKQIFEMSLKDLQLSNHEVLFVGDSLQDDYQGAVNSDIDFCYYNRRNIEIPKDLKPNYMISSLLELKDVVGL